MNPALRAIVAAGLGEAVFFMAGLAGTAHQAQIGSPAATAPPSIWAAPANGWTPAGHDLPESDPTLHTKPLRFAIGTSGDMFADQTIRASGIAALDVVPVAEVRADG